MQNQVFFGFSVFYFCSTYRKPTARFTAAEFQDFCRRDGELPFRSNLSAAASHAPSFFSLLPPFFSHTAPLTVVLFRRHLFDSRFLAAARHPLHRFLHPSRHRMSVFSPPPPSPPSHAAVVNFFSPLPKNSGLLTESAVFCIIRC